MMPRSGSSLVSLRALELILWNSAFSLRGASAGLNRMMQKGARKRSYFSSSSASSALSRWLPSIRLKGRFAVDQETALDNAMAEDALAKREFIFDVQTHCVDPNGSWIEGTAGERWRRNLTEVFGQAAECRPEEFDCFSAQVLAKEVFLDSDTDVAVASALWGEPSPTPRSVAAVRLSHSSPNGPVENFFRPRSAWKGSIRQFFRSQEEREVTPEGDASWLPMPERPHAKRGIFAASVATNRHM